MSDTVHLRVDVCGKCCPIPLIVLAKTVSSLKPGQAFEILGNDPLFESAVHNFCQCNGHTVLGMTTGANHGLSFLIKVGGRT